MIMKHHCWERNVNKINGQDNEYDDSVVDYDKQSVINVSENVMVMFMISQTGFVIASNPTVQYSKLPTQL